MLVKRIIILVPAAKNRLNWEWEWCLPGDTEVVEHKQRADTPMAAQEELKLPLPRL